jgi:hypothetical protein
VHQDLLESLEQLDPQEQVVNLANEEKLDTQVPEERKAHVEPQVQLEKMVLQVLQDHEDHQDPPDCPVPLVLLELKELSVKLDFVDQLVNKESKEPQVPKDQLVH